MLLVLLLRLLLLLLLLLLRMLLVLLLRLLLLLLLLLLAVVALLCGPACQTLHPATMLLGGPRPLFVAGRRGCWRWGRRRRARLALSLLRPLRLRAVLFLGRQPPRAHPSPGAGLLSHERVSCSALGRSMALRRHGCRGLAQHAEGPQGGPLVPSMRRSAHCDDACRCAHCRGAKNAQPQAVAVTLLPQQQWRTPECGGCSRRIDVPRLPAGCHSVAAAILVKRGDGIQDAEAADARSLRKCSSSMRDLCDACANG
jgi:hypothetical protein